MNISLKIRVLSEFFCLLNQGFMASGLNNSPLMEGQGTKAAGAEAPPIADQAKLNLPCSHNPACRLIGRMIAAHVEKAVHLIHFLLRERLRGRILHHIFHIIPAAVGLYQPSAGIRVRIFVLDPKAAGILPLILFHILIIRQKLIVKDI